MSNASLIAAFTAKDSSAFMSDRWATLEQADTSKATQKATIRDLHQMRALAMSGRSAREYLYDVCPYARIADGVLTVQLDFFVWVSSMDLPYSLQSSRGEISPAVLYDRPRALDVIFNNSASENLGFIFDGIFAPEMPFFDAAGQIIPDPEITIDGSNVQLSMAATGVLRATCMAHGYRHTLTLTLEKTPIINTDPNTGVQTELSGYALGHLETDITVMWVDVEGNPQTNILAVQIPDCVEDMVTACNGQKIVSRVRDGEPQYLVFYSTCNGNILDEYWQDEP